MRTLLALLVPLLAWAAPSAQQPCGGIPGVEVTVDPPVAGLGQTVVVTVTNHSSQTIDFSSSCAWKSVHPDDCSAPPVFAPFCLLVITSVPPGGSLALPWDQTDFAGAQVPAGTYGFSISYFDSAFSSYTCCPTVEICSGPPVAAQEVTRVGSPPNPAAFLPGVSAAPLLGKTWDPVVDHAGFVPGSVLDVVGIALSPANIASSLGTILCDPATLVGTATATPGSPFAVPVPAACTLLGVSVCTQAASVAGDGSIALTNALDLVLGTL